ncbi:acyltransferase [Gordonia sp. ABSL11-1]|uniref:acyltransferase family protein n=1 Tax=Gordonia sp. ABSL11-1 TaxID=3053924 RepID=UPI0025730840|nr:acyltransferase [Gordonia sp. ABSL11-1]MDL9947254.1 acyltransferase [Gordonia sp. ABSL11-1]
MAARIPALTGIRTIAALSVCLTHAAFWTGHYTDDYVGRLLSRFEVGVAIFFVLSGYLLFAPWVNALADGRSSPSVGRYFWHRARRILPAYWLTVIAVYALFLVYDPPDASPTGTGLAGFLRNMTLTQVYGVGHLHSGLTQMWSLAAEVVFYLLLPVIAWVLVVAVCRRRWRPDLLIVGLLALMLVSPIWSAVVAGSNGIDATARLGAPAFLGWFVAGMLLAVCTHLVRRWNPTISVGIAVAAFLLSGTAIAGEPTITPTTASATIVKHVLYIVVAVGLIGPLTVRPPGILDDGDRPDWWSRVCGSRPIVWLGEISYEFFLVHVLVLEILMDILGYGVFSGSMPVAFIATTVVSVPVAWGLHRLTRPLWRARTPGAVATRR